MSCVRAFFGCLFGHKSQTNPGNMVVSVRHYALETYVDWNPAYLSDWSTLVEVESIKTVKHTYITVNSSDLGVSIGLFWLWDRICVAYLHGLAFGISQWMKNFGESCQHKRFLKSGYTSVKSGKPVWTWPVRIPVIQACGRNIDKWKRSNPGALTVNWCYFLGDYPVSCFHDWYCEPEDYYWARNTQQSRIYTFSQCGPYTFHDCDYMPVTAYYWQSDNKSSQIL
jgi:hypothetical protein